jgi:hypothetical protein
VEKRVKLLYSLSMGRLRVISWALLVFGLAIFAPEIGNAGDEDTKKEASAPVAPAEPEPAPTPEEPEAPDLSLGEEPEATSPSFEEPAASPAAARAKRRAAKPPYDPDKNINYTELMALAEPGNASRGVLPPAQGTRGYRPNLVAASAGDRTPGYGGFVEYSWNRLAAGVFFAYRPLRDVDRFNEYQTIGGLYGTYRWLPWDFSPYALLGLEIGSKTPETFGGLAGLGMEARIYSGWTALLGYTFHSTVRKGFWGGAFGWSF